MIAYPPCCGVREIFYINPKTVVTAVNDFGVITSLEGFVHELAVILNRNPDGAQIHLNIGGSQRFRGNTRCLNRKNANNP